MAGGLAALLDDIAAIAKVAAASIDDVGAAAGRAGAKAAGVVVDDTAVTPRYLDGFDPSRELPVIKQIAIGSLRNKLLIILPVALLLSQFADWALTPILMAGGSFLCFEGAEKLWEKLAHHEAADAEPVLLEGPEREKQMVAGAVRTDLILSTEIMMIALDEVAHTALPSRIGALVLVAIVLTILVYGVVAVIVKMDDVGLRIAQGGRAGSAKLGEAMVTAMPKVLSTLSWVGMVAMLWVGGHILLTGLDDLGWHWPYTTVHHLQESVAHALGPVGGVAGWLTATFGAAVLGIIVGAVIVVVVEQVHKLRHRGAAHAG